MKTFTTLFVLSGLLVLSPFAFAIANTYGYIDQHGDMKVIVADSPQEAITAAPDIAPHSGVVDLSETNIVLGASTDTADADTEIYQYVSVSGELKTIRAASPSAAIAAAPDRAPHSGVLLVSE